jgi:hypothetical protein
MNRFRRTAVGGTDLESGGGKAIGNAARSSAAYLYLVAGCLCPQYRCGIVCGS